jgi:hypothetical protein
MKTKIYGAFGQLHAKRNYTQEELDKTIHGLEAEVDIMEIIPEILKEVKILKINWNLE